MVLIDTSIWVDFLKGKQRASFLLELIDDNEIVLHPFILGELILDGLSSSDKILLQALPKSYVFDIELIEQFISDKRMKARGVGYIDCCLLYSCIMNDHLFATFDQRLAKLAKEFHIFWS